MTKHASQLMAELVEKYGKYFPRTEDIQEPPDNLYDKMSIDICSIRNLITLDKTYELIIKDKEENVTPK